MAKWYGKVGFAITRETDLDEWTEDIKEIPYSGDLVFNNRSLEGDTAINNDITITNKISFIADPYARSNFHSIRYLTFMGSKWRIRSIEVAYPRLIVTLGGLWEDAK